MVDQVGAVDRDLACPNAAAELEAELAQPAVDAGPEQLAQTLGFLGVEGLVAVELALDDREHVGRDQSVELRRSGELRAQIGAQEVLGGVEQLA